MALASGGKSYTPPLSIQQMESRMASFPQLWAEEGDEVLTDWTVPYAELQGLHPDGLLVPMPWGWSLAIKYKLLRWGVPESVLPSDASLQEWRMFSNRGFAVEYLRAMLASPDLHRWSNHLIGGKCSYFSSVEDFYLHFQNTSSENTLAKDAARIFKSPWSSSGRGVFISNDLSKVRKRLEGYVRHQGGFVVDSYYNNKVLDGALEFFVEEDGSVRFLGFSVFLTDGGGHYLNHFVESQWGLRQRFVEALGFPDADGLLDCLVDYHLRNLSVRLGHSYRGPLGIDVLVSEMQGVRRLHPCIEINLRMNMGIVALLQYQRNPSSAPRFLFPTSC